jgi:hypothetical protein
MVDARITRVAAYALGFRLTVPRLMGRSNGMQPHWCLEIEAGVKAQQC